MGIKLSRQVNIYLDAKTKKGQVSNREKLGLRYFGYFNSTQK